MTWTPIITLAIQREMASEINAPPMPKTKQNRNRLSYPNREARPPSSRLAITPKVNMTSTLTTNKSITRLAICANFIKSALNQSGV